MLDRRPLTGDSLAAPRVVPGLPFSDTDTSSRFADKFPKDEAAGAAAAVRTPLLLLLLPLPSVCCCGGGCCLLLPVTPVSRSAPLLHPSPAARRAGAGRPRRCVLVHASRRRGGRDLHLRLALRHAAVRLPGPRHAPGERLLIRAAAPPLTPPHAFACSAVASCCARLPCPPPTNPAVLPCLASMPPRLPALFSALHPLLLLHAPQCCCRHRRYTRATTTTRPAPQTPRPRASAPPSR